MNTVEILKAARELISDEKSWTKGAYARNARGTDVPFERKDAVCFCTVGALFRVSPEGMVKTAWDALAQECELIADCGLVRFNDNHTHPEVLALFDRAIARAEGGAA